MSEPLIINGAPLVLPENRAWVAQPGSQQLWFSVPYEIFEVIAEGTRGGGKRISNSNLVLTDSGWKKVGLVSMGDRLVASDGSYTELLGVFPSSSGKLYRITFDDDSWLEVDGPHRWSVRSATNGYRDGWRVKTTDELIESIKRDSWYIPTCLPTAGKPYSGLDSYTIGLLLGDGCTTHSTSHPTLYSQDDELLEHMVITHGWTRYEYVDKKRATSPKEQDESWRIACGSSKGPNKIIPNELLLADPATRLSVLQGLMDSDGTVDPDGRMSFCSVSYALAKGVQYLARSLGGKSRICWKQHSDKMECGGAGYYHVGITCGGKFNPFRLARKALRVREQNGQHRKIMSIEPVADGPATCFAVAHPSHEFVCQSFVVTHNTDMLIMDFAREVGQGFGAEWCGYLFKRTNPELQDVIQKCKKWLPLIFPKGSGCEVSFVGHPYFMCKWSTGEWLMLRHMENEDDYWDIHGSSVAWMGWEELSNWPTPVLFLKCMSCVRSSHPEVARRKRVRATTNPGGAGHNWIRERYQLPMMRNQIIRASDKLLAKKWNIDKTDTITTPRMRMAIFSDIRENKIFMEADPTYLDGLKQDANSEAQYRAWVYGDWNIVAGGMFDDVWNQSVHWIKGFDIPRGWKINRSFDWGDTSPFSIGFWAQSDGSDVVLKNGKAVSTVRGDLFRIGEYYGWNGTPNVGLKLTSTEIAEGCLERELKLRIYDRIVAGPADTSIFSGFDGKASIAEDMMKPIRRPNGKAYRGITWTPARKGPNSRIPGWVITRKLLKNAIRVDQRPRERPGVFIFENCMNFGRTIPVLPRDAKTPDDVDSEAEDHIADEFRYRAIEVNSVGSSGTTTGMS